MGKDYSSPMNFTLGNRLSELRGPLLLTGHTGFKGTWMTFLLEHLNVRVIGYSLPAEKDSLYERAERASAIPEVLTDIRNYEALEQFIDLHKPSTIIHMAAQPLVLKSYEHPRYTFDVNVMGTVNVLDIAFKKDFVEAIIVVTTDKVYRNDNSGRTFVETDPLEGKDPYSASKVGAEAVVAAWQHLAKISGGPHIAAIRAGNVIGGGDWATDRLLPDLIRASLNSKTLTVRNPKSIRPWQHVVEPIVWYLVALESLLIGESFESMNIGPSGSNLTVKEVIDLATENFGEMSFHVDYQNLSQESQQESHTLSLDSTLARNLLGFTSIWSQDIAIFKTMEWWKRVYFENCSPKAATLKDITDYLEMLVNN